VTSINNKSKDRVRLAKVAKRTPISAVF